MGLHRFAQGCEKVFDVIAALMLAVIVGCVAWQVFDRYALGHTPSWTEELCGMLFVWMSMVGAAACLRSGQHLAITTLLDAVSGRTLWVLLWLRDLAMLAAFWILAVASYRFAVLNMDQDSPSLEVPLTVHYSAVIVGTALMALLLIASRVAGRPIPFQPEHEESVML